ncbi:MAG TPA: type VI secretion system contractile sheath small subunit [Pyrinomonadaceae bacterium]|jgi:type VI secretion system ImpB/VipA family protein
MPESTQHKLDRVRRPRVQITYDVETLGSIVKTQLPFVVGIMADLSGNTISKTPGKPLKDRKYVEIDRDNFDTIMDKVAPTLQLKTTGHSDSLTFKKLDDFNPLNVLRRVPSLSEKFDSRTRLSNLVAKLDGNVELQRKFIESYNALDPDAQKALGNYYKAMYPAPGTPSVTDAETTPGAPTTSGLIITPSENGPQATHFKITDITGGNLYKSDGKIEITANGVITADEGAAGLKFKPAAGNTKEGSFTVQASTDKDGSVLTGDPVIATITVTQASTPARGKVKVTPATVETQKNTMTPALKITPDPADPSITHFKITDITGGKLFKDDETMEIKEGNNFITAADAAIGVKFKPTQNSTANGSFTVTASTKADNTGLIGDPVIATITVAQAGAGGKVKVTPATVQTQKNTMTTALVITLDPADATITHFKITDITGGKLFKANGSTEIKEPAPNNFITASEGADGVKFKPTQDSTANGSFTVTASTKADETGVVAGNTATVTITVA